MYVAPAATARTAASNASGGLPIVTLLIGGGEIQIHSPSSESTHQSTQT